MQPFLILEVETVTEEPVECVVTLSEANEALSMCIAMREVIENVSLMRVFRDHIEFANFNEHMTTHNFRLGHESDVMHYGTDNNLMRNLRTLFNDTLIN
jgi:hypothetical protein